VRLSATDATADEVNPDASGNVMSVILSGNNTILAGSFTSIAGVPVQGVANLVPFGHTAPPGKPTGNLADLQTLTMTNNGTWQGFGGISYEYNWQRCAATGKTPKCTSINGALNSSYVLAAADVGSRLQVEVTASDALASSSLTSPLTGIVAPANTTPPKVRGHASRGSTLTLSNGIWDGVKGLLFHFGWQRCSKTGGACRNIAGASSAHYTLKSADVNHTVRGIVYASKNHSAFSSGPSAVTGVVH
jgi:hypothetical protein